MTEKTCAKMGSDLKATYRRMDRCSPSLLDQILCKRTNPQNQSDKQQ